MTAAPDLSSQEETDAVAAEYVLGVLSLQDRLAAEAQIKSDPAFAARVLQWETDFEPMNDAYESAPAPDLMPKIEARLFGQPAVARSPRNWWRFVTGAGLATALVIAVLTALPQSGSGPVLTASLAADAQELVYSASYSNGELTLARQSGPAADAQHDYELWVINGDAAPVSLGLIKGTEITVAMNSLAPGAVLAISLEPTGGSTTGAPTGPVLVTGVIVAS